MSFRASNNKVLVLTILLDPFFDIHVNLLSILQSIDIPREFTSIEGVDSFPI